MKTIIVASGNPGKIKEVKEIFGDEFKIISIKELEIQVEAQEDAETFEENAIKKAEIITKELKQKTEAISNKLRDFQIESNKWWVLADDSGIEVEALDGFPGVNTKRWFDGTDRERNLALITKLNNSLREKKNNNRKVSFITAIAVSNGEKNFCKLGILQGRIVDEPRGDNGFGFDEIFELENGKTLAELTNEEKNKISARKIALEKIREQI